MRWGLVVAIRLMPIIFDTRCIWRGMNCSGWDFDTMRDDLDMTLAMDSDDLSWWRSATFTLTRQSDSVYRQVQRAGLASTKKE